jgi:hypothetical protein
MKTLLKWSGIVTFAVVAFILGTPFAVATAAVATLSHVSVFVAGATLGANVLTLADWAKRLDPDGDIPDIVENLAQTNEILDDMSFVEGNLPTGMRTTIRTGLPAVYWRLINQGTPPSKSTTAQVDETAGILEAWSEVDTLLARLNGNVAAFRDSEAQPFRESMSQTMATTLFYGNQTVSPEQFTGLTPRYSSLSATNAQNIVDAGAGSGGDNSSIWLVVWGPQTITGFFPKGSKAGLEHNDYGEVTVETTAGIAGNRMRAFQEMWQWQLGIAVRDWRYAVRIANIDISELVANDANSAKLFQLMTLATHRVPSLNAGRPVFYANRTIAEYLDIQGQDKVASGGQMSYNVIDGRRITSFRGIPIRTVDALTQAETAVS